MEIDTNKLQEGIQRLINVTQEKDTFIVNVTNKEVKVSIPCKPTVTISHNGEPIEEIDYNSLIKKLNGCIRNICNSYPFLNKGCVVCGQVEVFVELHGK